MTCRLQKHVKNTGWACKAIRYSWFLLLSLLVQWQRLLERSFWRSVAAVNLIFFMLFWANETWAGAGLVKSREVLIGQSIPLKMMSAMQTTCKGIQRSPIYKGWQQTRVFIIYRPTGFAWCAKAIAVIANKQQRRGWTLCLLPTILWHKEDYNHFKWVLTACWTSRKPQLGALPQFMENSFPGNVFHM